MPFPKVRVCQCGASPSVMDESPWWPSGIIHEDSESFDSGKIRTEFGTLNCWNYQDCLTVDWWAQAPNQSDIVGTWPEVTEVSMLREDRKGLLLKINTEQIARVLPFSVGNDLSRMVRHEPWNNALQSQPVILPSMVYFTEGNDRVAVYDLAQTVNGTEIKIANKLAGMLGQIHSALDEFSTPNTERRWNDRLKDIEAELKTSTLWRAPHSSATVGLPRLNFDLELLGKKGDEIHFIADSRSPVEHILCEADRLPGLAHLMMIEQQISFTQGMDETARKELLDSWLTSAPSNYNSKKALSTLLGGPWIWRYHAVLLALGEARMYGDEPLRKKSQRWLNDVSRIQAHLGVLRLWKSGLWGGITGAVIAFFAWRMESISPTIAGITGISCMLFAILSNQIYWAKDPNPY